jgi:hypothetical protein
VTKSVISRSTSPFTDSESSTGAEEPLQGESPSRKNKNFCASLFWIPSFKSNLRNSDQRCGKLETSLVSQMRLRKLYRYYGENYVSQIFFSPDFLFIFGILDLCVFHL